MNFGLRGLVYFVWYSIVSNDSMHVAELHIGSFIRYEHSLFGNYFLKCYIVKRILISFICFSEYIMLSTYVPLLPTLRYVYPLTPFSGGLGCSPCLGGVLYCCCCYFIVCCRFVLVLLCSSRCPFSV